MADYSKYFPTSDAPATDFSAYFPEPAAPTTPPARPAPGSQPLPSNLDRLQQLAKAGVQGWMMGGPIPAATMMTGAGLQQFGDFTNRTAYKAGGAITDVGASAGLPPEVSAGLGFTANMGTQLGGMLGTGAVTKAFGSPLFESMGRSLMGRALKPPLAATESGDAAKAIDTMLNSGFNVTPGGVAKMQQEISKLDAQVKDAIAKSSATVNNAYPLAEIYSTLQRFRNQVNPTADIDAIRAAWNEFKNIFPMNIPVQQAQALKQGTYSVLAGKYGEQGSASVEAQKALARGERIGIGHAVPQVNAPLAREAELMNAFELASRRVGLAGNRDPSGLAYAATNAPAAAGMLAERSQLVKSLLARGLYSGREYIPGTIGYGGYIPFAMYSGQQE